MSMKPTLTIEELAFEQFPDEIFEKNFQREVFYIYNCLVDAIASIENPIQRYGKYGWQIVYNLGFFHERGYGDRDDFVMTFLEPRDILEGAIEVAPLKEPHLDRNILLQRNELVFFPSGVQPVSPKYFRRRIKFIDIKNQALILKYLNCSHFVLERASKRFPSKGLLVIETNKIFGLSHIVKSSSSYFPKLQKFTKKIQKILKEIEQIETQIQPPPIN